VSHAIRKHLRDFVAMIALAAVGIGTAGYILSHERLRFPLVEDKPFKLKAEFSDAQGVMPGQGQTIRVAGMRVGDIGKVELEEGRAIVTMDLDKEFDDLVHEDATALLRPRTGLKDMFIALDPGSESAPLMKEDTVIQAQNTAPDVDADEILRMLDTDTRAYFRLLIAGVGKGLAKRGGDLREVFRRLGPLQRDIGRLQSEVATRRRNLARLIHNYGSSITELSTRDRELTTLVRSARRVFEAIGSEDENVSLAVSRLPGTLGQAKQTLLKVNTLGQTMGPAFDALRPAVRQLDKTNDQVRPFAREAAPILQNRIRPFVRAARPFVRDVKPAARNLAKAVPDLRESFFELNRFFNLAAHNPRGAEKLSGGGAQTQATPEDLNRDEGILFWLAWVSQNSNSVFSTADASGPFRRLVLTATCTTYKGLVDEEPGLEALAGLTDLLSDTQLCPPD
jgi:phospholipid/cholesterol/gamma-HCH transport system substrate-binding protein